VLTPCSSKGAPIDPLGPRRFPRGGIGPAAGAIGVLIAGVLIGGTQSGLLSVGNIAAASVWICVLTLPVLARESRP